jgi:hypothetical protein
LTLEARQLLVGWKVSSLSAKMASVRYRALLPIIALDAAGVRSRVFTESRDAFLEGLDALVIVKSFTPDDLLLAQVARDRGIKVFIDLCDNIFIGGYGSNRKGISPASMFVSMAEHAHCIVATTEPLAAVVREHVPDVPVIVIPDGIELAGLGRRMREILAEAAARQEPPRDPRPWRRRMRTAVHLMRDQGVAAIPVLVETAARKLGGAMVRRVRHTLHRPPPARVPEIGQKVEVAEVPMPNPNVPRLVWFGNHGAEHGRFGMLDLLEWREALEALAREREVELVIVSNNLAKYEANIQPLQISSRYVEWSPEAVDDWLQGAAAVLIPNSLDSFSTCKSANRTVLALAKGVPVVATMTPALQPLADFIDSGDPLQALRNLLADPVAARNKAFEGYRHAETLFGASAIQLQWLRALESTPASAGRRPDPYLAVVLHLIQDLDLALPILDEARQAGISCEAWCTTDLLKKSPRVLPKLKAQRFAFRVLPEEEGLASFVLPAQTRALLTIAETSLAPHRIPRVLTEMAARQGRLVATLQHGFENVGLTYEDEIHSLENVDIAAQRIYTWGPLNTLHPRLHSGVRSRCVPMGCPKEARVAPADLGSLLPAGRPIVGVFENLHWHRYSEEYRAAFLQNVEQLARSFPEVCFLVKPHHAGLWLSHRYQGDLPDAGNLVIADPKSREWERHTATALLPHLICVITTPSTVALDAARQRLPVSVFALDLHLDNYQPLPLLISPADWTEFVAQALDPVRRPALEGQAERFVQRVLVPGNAAKHIVEDLRETAGA